jgi:hypothetical protein
MVSNSNGNNAFVAGAPAQLAFATTAAMIVYLNCNSVTSLSSALTKTLVTPCALTVPSAGCTIAASIQSQINTLCFGETGSATATSTGGTAAGNLFMEYNSGSIYSYSFKLSSGNLCSNCNRR